MRNSIFDGSEVCKLQRRKRPVQSPHEKIVRSFAAEHLPTSESIVLRTLTLTFWFDRRVTQLEGGK